MLRQALKNIYGADCQLPRSKWGILLYRSLSSLGEVKLAHSGVRSELEPVLQWVNIQKGKYEAVSKDRAPPDGIPLSGSQSKSLASRIENVLQEADNALELARIVEEEDAKSGNEATERAPHGRESPGTNTDLDTDSSLGGSADSKSAKSSMFVDCLKDLSMLHEEARSLRLESLFHDPDDQQNCYLELRAGQGGGDSCYWLERLMTMYMQWGTSQGLRVKLVASEEPYANQDYVGGHRFGCLLVEGHCAFGWLRGEQGVHRFQHITPFGQQKAQTGHVSVAVFPDVSSSSQFSSGSSSKVSLDLNKQDLRIETFRSSGRGGQHVNTTDSAVRITHLPSGLNVSIQESRSQHENRRIAMSLLQAKVAALEADKAAKERAQRLQEVGEATFGEYVRSYKLLKTNVVNDHGTGLKDSNPNALLDQGIGLDRFLEAKLSLRLRLR